MSISNTTKYVSILFRGGSRILERGGPLILSRRRRRLPGSEMSKAPSRKRGAEGTEGRGVGRGALFTRLGSLGERCELPSGV